MSIKPNNNPKNKEALLRFQRRQLELSKQSELAAKRKKVQDNLDLWESKVPKIYKNACPKSLPSTLLGKISSVPLKEPFEKYIVISAKESTVATFVVFSIVHGLLQLGMITPSQVRKTSLLDGYNNINGMFQSRNWKDYFFSEKAKVLIIEGSSKTLTMLGQKGEEQFWRELDDFTKAKDILVIITYLKDKEESDKEIFIPTLTLDKMLNSELVKKSAYVTVNNEEENNIEIKQRETY